MAIKINVRTLKNSKGTGDDILYAVPEMEPAMNARQLEERISDRCTLTAADIRAVLSALSDVAREELAEGKIFHIPEIGSLSLRVKVDEAAKGNMEKLKGNHVSVRGISFRPEVSLLNDVKQECSFTRSQSLSHSLEYDESTLKQKLEDYLKKNSVITSRAFRLEFGLKEYKALSWLKQLVETGFLKKAGSRNSPVYVLGKE